MTLHQNEKNTQDYIVVPEQSWVDECATQPGLGRQFVDMPMGERYTFEAQLKGEECLGGLQLEITPSTFTPGPMQCTDNVDGDFNVEVLTASDVAKRIHCRPTDSILAIKIQFYYLVGVPFYSQDLIYEQTLLSNGKSLL